MQILLKWICYFKYRSQHINWIIWVDFFLTNSLFIWYLFRLYKKNVKKESEIKQKWLLKRQKNQNKKYKCAKIRIK